MLDFALGNNPLRPPCPSPPPSDRKLRLLAAACCRHVWPLLADPRARRAVEAAEQYADGKRERLEVPWLDWRDGTRDVPDWLRYWAPCAADPAEAARRCRGHPPMAAAQAALLREVLGNPFRPLQLRCHWCGAVAPPRPACARCGFGFGWLPHDPPADPLALATAIYADRDFAALPVLADVLEEAGCEEEDMLMHLRGRELCTGCSVGDGDPDAYSGGGGWCALCDHSGPGLYYMPLRGPHALGAWSLDLVLGKG